MPIEIKGLIETRSALKHLAPDLYKEMNLEIKQALKEVTNVAKDRVPPYIEGLTNWQEKGNSPQTRTSKARAFPKYDPNVIRRGLTYSLGRSRRNSAGFVSLYRLLNKSAVGAIIETAGRKNPKGSPRSQSNNPNAGQHFIERIQGAYGGLKPIGDRNTDRGRLLYKAYYENNGKARDAIFKAIEKAKAKFYARTNTRTDLAA